MVSQFSGAFAARSVKAKPAFYTAIVSAILLVPAGHGYAASPSNASLSGKYIFQITTAQQAYWSASKPCGSGNNKYTAYADNTDAYSKITYGVITFSGSGTASITFTDENEFDESASNATIVITCGSNGSWTSSGGEIVYEPPQSGTGSGTYTVESNGTATLTLTVPKTSGGSESVTLNLSLGGFNSSGIATTVLIRNKTSTNGKNPGTGIATHE